MEELSFSDLPRIFFNMDVMEGQWSLLFSGMWVTLEIAVISIVLSTVLGLFVALIRIGEDKLFYLMDNLSDHFVSSDQ